ncbi:hypothetical protein J4V07_23465 [Escherichia coli]
MKILITGWSNHGKTVFVRNILNKSMCNDATYYSYGDASSGYYRYKDNEINNGGVINKEDLIERLITDEGIIIEVPSSRIENFFNEMNFNIRLFDIAIIVSLINCSNPHRQFMNSLKLYESVSFDTDNIILTINHSDNKIINEDLNSVSEIKETCRHYGMDIIHMPHINDIEKNSALRMYVNHKIQIPDADTLSEFRLKKLQIELKKIDNLLLDKNKSVTRNCISVLDKHLNRINVKETKSLAN